MSCSYISHLTEKMNSLLCLSQVINRFLMTCEEDEIIANIMLGQIKLSWHITSAVPDWLSITRS